MKPPTTYKIQEPLRGRKVPVLTPAFATVLRDYLDTTKSPTVAWLDLGCGRGQLLKAVCASLDRSSLERLAYTGYDCTEDFVEDCQFEIGKSPIRKGGEALLGEFDNLEAVRERSPFDVISVVELFSDLHLHLVSHLLLDIFQLGHQSTRFFMSDIRESTENSLMPGTLPWRLEEIDRFMETVGEYLGMTRSPRAIRGGVEGGEKAWALTFSFGMLPVNYQTQLQPNPELQRHLNLALYAIFEERRNLLNGEVESKVRQFRSLLRSSLRHRNPTVLENKAEYFIGDPSLSQKLDSTPSAASGLVEHIDISFREYWACESETSAMMIT
jgi:hypothetical protein